LVPVVVDQEFKRENHPARLPFSDFYTDRGRRSVVARRPEPELEVILEMPLERDFDKKAKRDEPDE